MRTLTKLLVKTALIIIAGMIILVCTEKSFITNIKSAPRTVKKVIAKLSHPLESISEIIVKN